MADAAAPFRIEGDTGEWEVVVGLEVHAQITATKSKVFSGAATALGAEANTQVSLVDAAMPGMLPVPNKECIRQAVRTGMALGAVINRWSRFDRKNYFYADLPQGYQISQLYHPLVGEGRLDIILDDKDPEGSTKTIGIERIHVEQDAGKLMHDQHPTMSYVDLNRSGVALMEIVSRPDMLPLELDEAFLADCRSSLPELPDAKRHRYETALGLSPYNAGVLTAEVETARWFERLVSAAAERQNKAEADVAKQAANWLTS